MAWSHLLSQASAMSNPWDYREIMRAAMRFNETRTVEEVVAAHKARDGDKSSKGKRAPSLSNSPPPKKAMDELQALMEMARAQGGGQVASNPDE